MTSQPSWLRTFRSIAAPLATVAQSTRRKLQAIQAYRATLTRVPTHELPGHVNRLRTKLAEGCLPTADSVVVPCFALVAEAFHRVLGIQLYEVQLQAGLALVQPAVAQMQTGEGKTFAASLPGLVYALSGRGVHVMTVNAYLAERDFEQLEPVFEALGVTVGFLTPDATPESKRAAYACDVTYGPGYDFGFDYLRDQAQLLARGTARLGDYFRERLRNDRPRDLLVQRGHVAAIVDEIDSVLLDEATTPLVLAWGGDEPAENAEVFRAALDVAGRLEPGRDYLEIGLRRGQLTPEGTTRLESRGQEIPALGLQRPWRDYVETALRAKLQFRRDIEYIVRDDQILLVDQHTGRIFADRSWQDGLHQAVQAKEGVTITREQGTLARITRQRFFRLYDTVCGMTGTAMVSRRELHKVYGLRVVDIPTHRPCRRRHEPARFFADQETKRTAIADDVAARHHRRQPVLVGTQTIEESQWMSALLDERQVVHLVLNGKQDEEEAAIVAAAGQLGAVTIATNMAGRGTDIPLGPGVAELGGLHVIVCEPHESARVDRQLIGRSARQGDPGSCQQFASGQDATIVNFAPQLSERIRREAELDGSIAHDFRTDIAKIQRDVEQLRFQQRRQMYAHDDWLESMLLEFASHG